MSYRLTGCEDIEVQFGGYRDGFELVIQHEGLARLVQLGQQALAESPDDDSEDELHAMDELVGR